ncbi:MAG: DNA repair protein RecN [Desulfobacterales bacterium]|nr:DNA repair protein RecN [Desulfobacterales bacterium]
MLRELIIKNLALIDSLHLCFDPGLTVLTGETGAGKSIILQALTLLAGGRASAAWVRSGCDRAGVEALFEIPQERDHLLKKINDQGVGCDNALIVKRVLAASGKSRYYLNGSAATARQVSAIVADLVSIAGQHDQQRLLAPAHHLDFIDAAGDLWGLRRELAELFADWSELKTRYQRLLKQEQEKEQRRDFLTFQCNEIKDAGLLPGEDEELQNEKDRLRSADTLKQLGWESYHQLADTVGDTLRQVRRKVEQIGEIDRSAGELVEAIVDSSFQVEDLTERLRGYLDTIPDDPSRLEEVDTRIDQLQRLKRKYGGSPPTLEQVLAHGSACARQLNELETMDRTRAELAGKLGKAEEILRAKAARLSAARRKQAGKLAAAMERELASLSFEHTSFAVAFAPGANQLEELTPTGWDLPEFMFSANPGEPVKPLAQIASGGELSRLMLALKCILARKDQVETVLLDEVDAGIGGRAAGALAGKIKELAGHHQVLCITHLPQIAARADSHFLVSKGQSNRRTRTGISRLDRQQRLHEIARMLAGETITGPTLDHARELLARDSEQ